MPRKAFGEDPTDDNRERAKHGRAVMTKYRSEFDPGEDQQTVLTDLLTDLMHAARPGVFQRALDQAERHYSWEVSEG
jgi:hypothetical protein